MDAPRAIVAALLALAAVLPVGIGCGGDSGPAREQLEWLDTPTVIVPPALATDRILRGDVRNESDDALRLEASKVRVYDDRGRRLKASATFAAAYLHSLYPPTRGPATLPDSELERLGKITRIEPGEAAQITVSWREPGGRATAARIDYGSGSLRIPPEAKNRRDRDF
ncbi:MAG: hypothetical protein ACRDLQ_11300 [Solirubrobacterales bacterium]